MPFPGQQGLPWPSSPGPGWKNPPPQDPAQLLWNIFWAPLSSGPGAAAPGSPRNLRSAGLSVLPDTRWSDSWLRSTRAKAKDASDEWPSASKLLEDRHHVVVWLPFASEFSTQGSELLPGMYRHLSRLRTATQKTSPCPQTPRIPFCTGSRQEQVSRLPSVGTAEEQT